MGKNYGQKLFIIVFLAVQPGAIYDVRISRIKASTGHANAYRERALTRIVFFRMLESFS